jgi:energy-coupling factor transporter ATP-binding protein EcfA2
VLSTDLLKKIGVDPDAVETVLENLVKNRRKTMGLLLLCREENEAKQVTGDDLSGQLLWTFIQEQKKPQDALLTAAGVGTGVRKRIAVTEGPDEAGIRKFMRQMVLKPLPLNARLNVSASAPLVDRMVPLGMELNDHKGRPESILFRQCYSDYFSKYIEPALARGQNVFIGGAQGIGKSVFTDLLALLLIEKHEVVLLQHFEESLLLVGKDPSIEAIKEVKAVLERSGEYDPESVSASVPGVYAIKDKAVFNDLVKTTHLFVIQDLGSTQGRTVSFDGRTKKIWVSSPNAEKLKTIRGDAQRLDLCVPPVSMAEMLEIYKHWNPHGYSEEQVRHHYSLYGGSVRLVLEMSENAAKDAQDTAIGEATRDSLHATFGSTLLNLPKGSMSSLLLHPCPRHGDPTRLQLRFASAETARRLFNKLISAEQRAAGTFLAAVREAPELGAFAGFVLEANMHERILKGIAGKLKRLGEKAGMWPEQSTDIPGLKLAALFKAEDFSDVNLDDLTENVYFRPTSENFPTIDAFAILPLAIFVPGATGLCLVTFQSTVSKSHTTAGDILERLFKRIRPKLGDIRRFHVFLTGPNGIRTKQTVDMAKADGGPYVPGFEPNVEQWALTLGDEFDELFNRLEQAQESGIGVALD